MISKMASVVAPMSRMAVRAQVSGRCRHPFDKMFDQDQVAAGYNNVKS